MKRLESSEINMMPKAVLHYKYIMMTFVILMVSTLAVAVFALATNYKYVNEMAELRAQNQHNSDLAAQVLRETRAAANENNKCKQLLQDELPAANLFGKSGIINHDHLEKNVPPYLETGVYRWLTADQQYGLITGGMTFNETNGHLRIPKNGTYYMFSTIRFRRKVELTTDVTNLTVDIKIISSCNSWSGNRGIGSGFNPKHYVVIPKGRAGGYYSVHTSGIARLCEKDVIYLHIHHMPPSKLEIRNGGGAYTNLGVFMIAPKCPGGTAKDSDTPTTRSARSTTPASTKAKSSPPPSRCDERDCQ